MEQIKLPSQHQPNDKVTLSFFDSHSPIECTVDAVKFDNHGKVHYDLIIVTPVGDTFIDNVASDFVHKL